MKLKDVLLVTNNNKGTEYKFLWSIEDYIAVLFKAFENSESEIAHAVKEVYQTKENNLWTEIYLSANKSYHAKFCQNEQELRNFLLGNHGMTEGEVCFDKYRCSEKCLDILKTYGMDCCGHSLIGELHYKRLGYVFRQGEILHNFNGCSYVALMKLDKSDLLLMDINSGQFCFAEGVNFYARYPKDSCCLEDDVVRGIEWDRGNYLGKDLSAIDIAGIQKRYEINEEEQEEYDMDEEMER